MTAVKGGAGASRLQQSIVLCVGFISSSSSSSSGQSKDDVRMGSSRGLVDDSQS